MNKVSKILCLATASVALVLAGCSKKPKRPDPSATVLGQQPGGGPLAPTDVGITADQGSQLQQREGVIETEDKIMGLFQPIYFDFDNSSIKQAERAKLQDLPKYLTDHPEQRVLFEGHCDWRGTAEYNLGLGDRRANAAKKYLSSIGVAAEKIETLSKGNLDAAKNADEATMAKDRRAEVVILKK